MKIQGIRWLVFGYVLCLFSLGAAPVWSASISPDAQLFIKTAQWGIPSAVLEWEADQLFEEKGIYNFTGRSPVPFTGLSVGWLATDRNADPAEFEVAIRTRREEEPWTEWIHTRGDIGPDDSPSRLFWSRLYMPFDGGVHTDFEIRVQPPVGILLTFVRASVADASAGLKITGLLEEPLKKAAAITVLGAPSCPPIISRSDWWGNLLPGELNSPRWPPTYRDITHAIIHHTVTTNNPSNPAEVVRNIWHFHANIRGWGDIGYNFLIDQHGNIYQGRYNAYLYTKDVHAAHAGIYNTRSLGPGLIGQFHPPWPDPPAGYPAPMALQSLEQLLAWKFDQRGLDPLGQATLVDKFIYRIAGHRDVAATACPGDNLYVLLPTIRTNVHDLIGIEETEERFEFGFHLILPNPFRERTVISYQIADHRPQTTDNRPQTTDLTPDNRQKEESSVCGLRSSVSLKIYDLSGKLVTTLIDKFQKPGRYILLWHGVDDRKEKVPSGVYFLRLTSGELVEMRKVVVIR